MLRSRADRLDESIICIAILLPPLAGFVIRVVLVSGQWGSTDMSSKERRRAELRTQLTVAAAMVVCAVAAALAFTGKLPV